MNRQILYVFSVKKLFEFECVRGGGDRYVSSAFRRLRPVCHIDGIFYH